MSDGDSDIEVQGFEDSNDFEIHEKFDENDNSPNTEIDQQEEFPEKGFPKAAHRSQNAIALGRDVESDMTVEKNIEDMTESEIIHAQKELQEKLGKDTCDFLIKRRLEKMKQQGEDQTPCDDRSNNKQKLLKEDTNVLELKMDSYEALKFEWTNPISEECVSNEKDSDLKLHQIRFDFSGRVLTSDSNEVLDKALYNHGLEPDKPGYTIPELLELLQSSFKPQVQLAIRTLANIICESYSTPNPYFGYETYRWFRYINDDVDLIGKVGYVVCNTKCTIVLLDALKCLSCLLFGYLYRDDKNGAVTPIQDSLFDFFKFDMGVDMYFTNSYSLDPFDLKLDHLHLYDKVSLEVQKNAFKGFIKDALDDKFINLDPCDINAKFKEIVNVQTEQMHNVVVVDPVMMLMTRGNIIKRLCEIMATYSDMIPIQVYCLNTFCGLMSRFESALADLLIVHPTFIKLVETLLNKLIQGTLENEQVKNVPRQQVEMLTRSVLYLIKYICIYATDAFCNFCDGLNAVALIKQTIRNVYHRHFYTLESTAADKLENTCMDENLLPAACTAIRLVTIWALKGEFYDALQELMPILDMEMMTITHLKAEEDPLLEDYIKTNGHVLAVLLMHIATCMGDVDFNFNSWCSFITKFNAFTETLSVLSSDYWSPAVAFLINATMQLQRAFLQHYLISDESAFQEWHGVFGSIQVILEALTARNILDEIDQRIIFGPKWFHTREHESPCKPLYTNDMTHNGIFDYVIPIEIISSILDVITTASKYKVMDIDTGHGSNLYRIKNRIASSSLEIQKAKNKIETSTTLMSSGIGVVTSILLLESWSTFIYRLYKIPTSALETENANGLVAALVNTTNFNLIERLFKLLPNDGGSGCNDVDLLLIGFKKFNEFICISKTLGSCRMGLVTFVAYFEMFPVLVLSDAIECEIANHIHKAYNVVEQNGKMHSALLKYLNPFHQLLQLTSGVLQVEDCASVKVLDIVRKLVFNPLAKSGRTHLIINPSFCPAEQMGNLTLAMSNYSKDVVKLLFEPSDKNLQALKKIASSLLSRFNTSMGDSPIIVGLLMLFISNISHVEIAKMIWRDSQAMLMLSKNLVIDYDNKQLVAYMTKEHSVSLGSILNFQPLYNSDSEIVTCQGKLLPEFNDSDIMAKSGILALVVGSLRLNNVEALYDFCVHLQTAKIEDEEMLRFIKYLLKMSEF
ncbi:bifunctional RNA polymerase II-associated protein RPAP1-Rba50/RNA polymerase II-associated protein 1 [Babesia duncani]|uniref:Bifunctional RNA polymerase II-associated protein RPAP1-Rba50/RNA polymerase II-associated protein 1 n=1 Tax=Babesia duncani TaxID=323732 RepID=A0AAD9PNR1_9APIC|nr:bifunctional RNA polymerase II-associated protein RPAP1-Rba50/RNA polymerase II-associated protein 1 [Babesia duncani]